MLDSIGKFNMHRFMNLMAHLGIPHSVIHDDDENKDQHADVNQLIQDSAHAMLTTTVRAIAGDLETMLGIAKPKSDHRKPQHLLFLYESGQIDPDKVEDFCELVESCIQSHKKLPQMMPNDEGSHDQV